MKDLNSNAFWNQETDHNKVLSYKYLQTYRLLKDEQMYICPADINVWNQTEVLNLYRTFKKQKKKIINEWLYLTNIYR